MELYSFLKFIFFVLFFLYLPAKIIFTRLKMKPDDPFIDVGLLITFGITFATLLTILLRLVKLDLLFLWLIPVVSLIYAVSNLKIPKSKISKGHILIFFVVFLGVITQNLVLFRGGWKTEAGYIFPSAHDTMWNIALVQEFYHHNPAQNPAMTVAPLKNNHYFYPLFLSVTRFMTDIDIYDLYFRFMPVLVSALFGLGIYAVANIFIKDIFFRATTVFLGYFSGSFAFLLPFFLKGIDWKGNTFFADQPFDQIINPYSVFGFTLMLFGIYCLSKKYYLVTALLFGILYGFKSFGGVLIVVSLFVYFFFSLIINRKVLSLPFSLTTAVLFSIVFLLVTDPTKASLIWAPGWLLTQLVTDRDKIYLPHLADIQNYYQSIGNYLGLWKIRIFEFGIYLFGNLGTRIVGLIYLVYTVFNTRPDKQKYILQFISIIVLISLSIPLLFNLSNSTFNIIQFTPYSLVLLAIASAFILEKIYRYFEKKHQKIWGILLIIIFVVLSIPVNVKNIFTKLETPQAAVTNEEMDALRFVRGQTKNTDVLLINPKANSQDPIYIPAISERRVYLASPGYAIQTGFSPDRALSQIDGFFKIPNAEFLKSNNINYVYLLKKEITTDELDILQKIGLTTIFENRQVIILVTK